MSRNLFQDREKRSFDRKQLFYYLKIYHDQTGVLAGYLGDISSEGLMLFTRDPIEKHTQHRFRINRDEDLGMAEDLTLDARSVWCEQDANPDYFIMGFKFIDLDQTGSDTVKYLMEKYGFDE